MVSIVKVKRTSFLYVRMGLNGHGIGRTWDRTDLPWDSFWDQRDLSWDSFWDRRDLPWDSFWDRTDMGSDGHGILSGNDPYLLISEG